MSNAKWFLGVGGTAVLGGLGVAATASAATTEVAGGLVVAGFVVAGLGVMAIVVGVVLFVSDWHAGRRAASDPIEPVLAQLSNMELKAHTTGIARTLREFQRKYSNTTARQTTRRLTTDNSLTDAERSRRFWEQGRTDDVERNVLMVEFGPLRVRAKAARDEILPRLGRPFPRPGDRQSLAEESATSLLEYGGFAGAGPADALADYLEGLALQLPNSGPSRGT